MTSQTPASEASLRSPPNPNAPVARGVAPWERHSHLTEPTHPQSIEQADRWRKAAADLDLAYQREAKRRRRAERAAARKEREEEEKQRNLESHARRMYYIGFFFLPLVWLVALFYFHREHRSENANPIIKKYYKNSRIMVIIYTIIFVTWFTIFQVYADSSLRKLNIIFFTGQSPTGF